MQPLRCSHCVASNFGHVVIQHIEHLHTTDGTIYLVADSAHYSEENLQKLAHTWSQWIPHVPAPLTEAQEALAQVEPSAMAPLMKGYRHHVLWRTYGGVVQRWVLIYSEHWRPQAQRTVDKHLCIQSTADIKAFKQLCRAAFACEACSARIGHLCTARARHSSLRGDHSSHAELPRAGPAGSRHSA